MENAKIENMYDLSQTIAGEYLAKFTYPWEALKGISDFIKKLGPDRKSTRLNSSHRT